ncbi:MAG TPA: NPCBM/NEW2 domain-containing protein, partial [Urbifossiella sp.]
PFLALIISLCAAAAADDKETPELRLERARKDFEEAVELHKKKAAEFFEKKEEAARAKSDKKALDLIKKQRATFDTTGELPPAASQRPFHLAIYPVRQKVNKAYADVVGDLIKNKQDEAAEAAERERRSFLVSSGLIYGKRSHLTAFKSFNLKPEKQTVQHVKILKTKKEEIPQSIGLEPPSNGTAQVSYNLAGKWSGLRVRVGIPEFPDTTNPPASEVTFEVFGDGESLWKSKPTKTNDEYQIDEICVEKIKILTLKVHCPESSFWCRACWLEPILAE